MAWSITVLPKRLMRRFRKTDGGWPWSELQYLINSTELSWEEEDNKCKINGAAAKWIFLAEYRYRLFRGPYPVEIFMVAAALSLGYKLVKDDWDLPHNEPY